MRKPIVCSALLAVVCSMAGCSSTSSWVPRWTWWKKNPSPTKETALAQASPQLPSRTATAPTGMNAPAVSIPGVPAVTYGQPSAGTLPAGYVAGNSPYGAAAGPYNAAAYGQTAQPGQYPVTSTPYAAAPVGYNYPQTQPSGPAAQPQYAPVNHAYPTAQAPGDRFGQGGAIGADPMAAQPTTSAAADAANIGGRYSSGSPYDQSSGGQPAANATADNRYTLQPAQPAEGATAYPTTAYPSTAYPSTSAPASASTSAAPISTADARNAYPGSSSAVPGQFPGQSGGFRPGGTSSYQPIQGASGGTSVSPASAVVPAGGLGASTDESSYVRPASAESSATTPSSVYQAQAVAPDRYQQ